MWPIDCGTGPSLHQQHGSHGWKDPQQRLWLHPVCWPVSTPLDMSSHAQVLREGTGMLAGLRTLRELVTYWLISGASRWITAYSSPPLDYPRRLNHAHVLGPSSPIKGHFAPGHWGGPTLAIAHWSEGDISALLPSALHELIIWRYWEHVAEQSPFKEKVHVSTSTYLFCYVLPASAVGGVGRSSTSGRSSKCGVPWGQSQVHSPGLDLPPVCS